jgi:hypothetical protein
VTNYPRNAGGVVITLTSSDTMFMSSTTVTIPQFAYSATFSLPTTVVNGAKGVTLKATYEASSITSNISILPIPTIQIVQAEYFTDTHLLKIAATTTNLNATFTWGTDPLGGALGTMQFELGQFKSATVLTTAPAIITVSSSDGGQATMAVTQKLSTAGGGGGTTYKIATSTNGKGTITMSPVGPTFSAGTVVTLTATPAAGSPWIGWSGACTGIATTCTLTMTQNFQVVANFR